MSDQGFPPPGGSMPPPPAAPPSAPAAPNYSAPPAPAAPPAAPNYSAPAAPPAPNYSAPAAPPAANYGTPSAPNYGAPAAPYGSPYGATPVRRGNGQLTAAGVMQIVQGGLFAIFGLWLFSVTQSEIGGLVNDLSGGALTSVAVFLLAMAGVLIWIGAWCIKARKGGWVTTVVFQSIFVAFILLGLANSGSDGGSAGSSVLILAYCGLTLGLALSGGKKSAR